MVSTAWCFYFRVCRVDYEGVKLHEDYAAIMPELQKLQCNEHDILLGSFLKSGNVRDNSDKLVYTSSFVSLSPISYKLAKKCSRIKLTNFGLGSTWLDSIVTLIVNDGNPESLLFGQNDKFKVFLSIEIHWSMHPKVGDFKFLDLVKNMTTPKTMRTHLPYSLLPEDVQCNKSKVCMPAFLYTK